MEASCRWEGELRSRQGRARSDVSRPTPTDRRLPDGVARVLETNRDITERKRAEAALTDRERPDLRSILDTVPDAMIVIDERGLVTSFSAAAAALFGYRAEEVVGQNVKILMPERYRVEHDSYIGNYLTTGEARVIGYGRLVQAVTKDGTVFPIELRIGEAHMSGRRIFTGFVRDLTSCQKMEQELRQSQKMEAVGQTHRGRRPRFQGTTGRDRRRTWELFFQACGSPTSDESLERSSGRRGDQRKLAANSGLSNASSR